MRIRELIKTATGPIYVISACTFVLFVLSFLIIKSLSEESAGQLQYWTMLFGSAGVALLIFLLIASCYSLYRQYVRNEIGSRLTVKLVGIFLFLTVIPFSLIYFFSIQFLNQGVDSWFDVRVEQAVQDARLLGQTSLEGIKDEITVDVETYAKNLPETSDASQLLRTLREIRELGDFTEVALYQDDGTVVAFSKKESSQMLPDTPGDEVFTALRISQTYTSLEPITKNTQQFRVVVPIVAQALERNFYGLQAIKLLPLRYATLASSVETALNQYDQILFARGPLKFTLILTLTLISLASLLFSILTAVYLSKRLVAPISNLAAGTRKIAAGDYGTSLPVSSNDELGILTDSFNDMSQKIEEAQQVASLSQKETEQQKGYLEAVLTNLSSGVFVFNREGYLEICNSAAVDILGISTLDSLGKNDLELSQQYTQLKQFFNLVGEGIRSAAPEWQDESTVLGAHGRQMLIVRGTLLHTASPNQQNNDQTSINHVVVFDDVTGLIQAQRDAAWGEVARRLAHEIKNPLTPIQLSAERIRIKLGDHVSGESRETLDRSTRTIVQQVEAMKEMVDAFSSYAQPVRAQLQPLDLNQLIKDLLELHATSLQSIELNIELQDDVPQIKANASALRQVLNNLIINACHALEGQNEPRLRICTGLASKIAGRYVDVIIEDSGCGIPTDIRESLFDPYVSSKAKGSGLGLAIVKRIVEEHSGSVWARDGEQGGTAMHIRLPINAMETYRGNRNQNTLHSDSS